jgi:hypothetical protein
MQSLEIVTDVSKLETIEDMNRCHDTYNNTMRCLSHHVKKIICFFVIIIIVGVVISITNKNIPDLPCIMYSPQTLASSVSITCLQYLWKTAGCEKNKPPIPNDYSGFYLNSPSGTNMVHCDMYHSGSNCGIGSYMNIVNNIQVCNLSYN